MSYFSINRGTSFLLASIAMVPGASFAQATKVPVSDGSPLKVLFGLLVVLATIAALAWVIKKMGHTKLGGQSVARIVGGVSVGSRERVVVVEIAGRWIVLGVASGRVNGIANLDIPSRFPELEGGRQSQADDSTDFKKNLSQYEYKEGDESSALANPALTSLLKKILKK